MALFAALALLAFLQGIIALREGARYLRFVRRELSSPVNAFTPRAIILAPCKGLDVGFEENIRAVLHQDYPDYQVVFIAESEDDPACRVIVRVLEESGQDLGNLVIAGRAETAGQKVHNLLFVLNHLPSDARALAFVDSDIRVSRQWLRNLIAPLADPSVGATTGYRWFLPERGSFWSLVRSIWNASIVTALGGHNRNFAWGGSMAILRETFERAGIVRLWQGAASDDYTLTRGVRGIGLSVRFVPRCLVPSRGTCRWGELLEFTTRQIVITRVYSPGLWALASWTNVLFSVTLLTGLCLVVVPRVSGGSAYWPGLLTLLVYLPGILKSELRLRAVATALPQFSDTIGDYRIAYDFLYPIASLVYSYNFARSLLSRKVIWRGARYELQSPNRTIHLDRTNDHAVAREGHGPDHEVVG